MTNEEREELIETIKQEILRLVAKRNCIIAGIEYNENSNYVDEFDICEALEHARAALTIAEPVIREQCAQICERRYMGDNTREDMEAKRCAAAIRETSDE